MSTTQAATAETPPRPGPIRRFIKLVATPVKLPAWAAIIISIFTWIPDWKSELEFWFGVVDGMGGYFGTVAAVVGSRYFSPALFFAGFLWLVFIGESPVGVQRPHWARYLGWSVVSICFAAIAVTALYGELEVELRRAYDQGAAGIARATPDYNPPAHPQRPLSFENRNLQPDQTRILQQELPKLRQFMSRILIAYSKNDMETLGVADQYVRLFERSGIVPNKTNSEPDGPEDEGLSLRVKDPKNVPISAAKLLEAFEVANIHPTVREMKDKAELSGFDFMFFVAPAHIN